MSDRDHSRTSTINFRDWIRGEGEFSEESLRKARDEFFTKLGQRLHQKMLEAMERAFSDLDAVPEARAAEPESSVPLGSGAAPANTQTAPPCVETDGPPSKGEGLNTQEPALWAVFLKDGSVSSVYWKKPEYRDTVPLYRSPTLAAEEQEAIIWCIELLDELESSKGDTLRSLLERLTRPPAGT